MHVTGRELLVRERLLDRLRSRWVMPLTVVQAPAGYGKTTLLTQARAGNAAAPLGVEAWVPCSPAMAVVSSLGVALCDAVGARRPGRADPDDFATAVVEAVWRRSPQQVTLLVDDVHEIPPGSDAAALLAAVVAALPDNGHVVLSGRTAPPIPLGRLFLERRVVVVDEADLAFTGTELAEFAGLRQVAGTRVAGCGGWPALAELFATARPGAAADYVAEEILAPLPVPARRDLARLAHVGPWDDDLAAAVVGPGTDVAALLAGLPLVVTGAGGERSLHSLWRTWLARDASSEEVAEARRGAARVLAERGRIDDAVRLLVEAHAWDDLGRAIVGALGAVHPPVARDVLEEWLRLLPDELSSGPVGRLLAAVIEVEGDIGGAWQDFEACAAAFRAEGETTGELACLVQLGQAAWWSDEPERLASVAGRVFELEAAGCEAARPFACLGRAMIYDLADDGRAMLAELERIPPGSLGEPWLGIVCWARAIAHLQMGHAAAAEQDADRALAYAGLHTPLAEGTRLMARWYQGHLADVVEALPVLLDQVTESGYRNSTVLIAAQCSMAHAWRSQPDRAARYLEQARATAARLPVSPLLDTNLVLAEAMAALASGDEAAAADVLAAYVARMPVGQGIAVAPQRRLLALFYVLVPGTRPVWDAAELGPAWAWGRELARALAAVRDRGALPAGAPALDDPGRVLAHLPPPWAAEVAVAAIAAGREDGWALLDATWPATRDTVAALAAGARSGLSRAAREVVGQLPVPPTARWTLRLLGPVELRVDDQPVRSPDWRRGRVRSLVAHLALHRSLGRGQIGDDLWPSFDQEAQSANLRVTLTYLLRVLEPDRAPRDASFFVRQHGGTLTLHPGRWLAVDVWDFDRLCDEAADADRRGAPATALDRALQAVELWRGEPTELLSDEWAVVPFEQRRRRFTAVATRAGELLLAQGATEHAQSLAEQALALDPWLDTAHRLVVAGHQAVGNDLAARRALRRYREAIRELGLGPDEATLMMERLLDAVPKVRDR